MAQFDVLLLSVHLLATVYMTGLVWFVQVVHYPLFAAVGAEAFPSYERSHVERAGWAVGPAMLVELATAATLLASPGILGVTAPAIGGALLLVIWASTWAAQVPLHRRLMGGFDARAAALLVRSNWVRTGAWSARSALALWMLLEGASS
ncbi:MAG: hypothetical protein IBJ10_04475 [Phycisphaerales bacterium]|nr:hypothetical protein [Phycisphaerales bacterium]